MTETEPGVAGRSPASLAQDRTPRRRRLADRGATWLVSVGGWGIIVSILAILFFILLEAFPLAFSADAELLGQATLAEGDCRELATDEYRSLLLVLRADGELLSIDRATEEVRWRMPAPEAGVPLRQTLSRPEQGLFAAATADGRVITWSYDFEVEFRRDERIVRPVVEDPRVVRLDPDGRPLLAFTASRAADGSVAVLAQTEARRLVLSREVQSLDFLTGETTVTSERSELACPQRVVSLALDTRQRNAYAGTAEGQMLWWPIDDGSLAAVSAFTSPDGPISALGLLLGQEALVVGHDSGALSLWFRVRDPDSNRFRLVRIREFEARTGPVALLAPCSRDRSFLAATRDGALSLHYSTTGATLWEGEGNVPSLRTVAYAPKGDGVLLAGATIVRELSLANPHPQTTWTTLFGKVWYEGLEEPAYVWQSTGGMESFESKMSLTPLLFGTLKGTLYAMLIAIPLGILGALYTAQFMHHSLRRYVKPTIELMASLPSVVLGFLAGLWLAPRMEHVVPGFFASLIAAPLAILVVGLLWYRIPRNIRSRLPDGTEAFFFVLPMGAALVGCFWANDAIESALFAGDFGTWLREATGLTYDQRNALVVGVAMGFAVIPIVFSISEDALSNVPRNLISGSLALGADRWQTMTRVVLPTASPGIFSAVMIGFGRAIGETMIVLMATGNTPVMDWNPFNGLRTLSANIAVEIPEAPHHGTLYRTLFLSALLLFVITFLVNTAAEWVRHRLRKRYASL